MPEIRVRSADQHRFRLRWRCPEGAKARLVWLPALGVRAQNYDAFAEALGLSGIETVVLENRGHATSSVRADKEHDFGYSDILYHDVPAALSELNKQAEPLPLYLGGHSLGAQLAALYTALHPQSFNGLVLAASGMPYWRTFGARAPQLLAAIAAVRVATKLRGYFPGHRFGFGRREARTLMRQWAASVWHGNYDVVGLQRPVEKAMQQLQLPVLSVRMADDWMVPKASLDALLEKLPRTRCSRVTLAGKDFKRVKADHFGWLKEPQPVAAQVQRWMDAI